MTRAGTPLLPPIASKQPPIAGDTSLQHVLEELYREQLALDPENGYLVEHGRQIAIAN
jgi:hypothetical protein